MSSRSEPTVVSFDHAQEHLEDMVEESSTQGTFFRIETPGLKPVMLVPGEYVDQLEAQIKAALG